MALTQTEVLSFLMTRGGKVKNTELLSAFTAHINCSEPEERRRNRDLFKSFINNVAVVKRVGDLKYVVVKKKYQEMINEGKFSIASSSPPSSLPSSPPSPSSSPSSSSPSSPSQPSSSSSSPSQPSSSSSPSQPQPSSSSSPSQPSSSSSPSQPSSSPSQPSSSSPSQPSSSSSSSHSSSPPSSSYTTQQSCFSRCDSRSITSADILNNNSWFCTSPPGCYINTSTDLVTKQQLQSRPAECDAMIAPVPTSNQEESLTSRLLNVANNTRKGKTVAVFAVVAIKSPPPSQTEKIQINLRTPACRQRLEIPPQQELKTVEAGKSSPYLDHEPDLNKSPRTKRRQTVVPSSPAPKRGHKVRKPGFGAKDSSAIRLNPREHGWLVMSATGRWSQLYGLLLQDVLLAEKRNFISGFTALHWAAKHGNVKMVRRILDVGENVDVNIKSYDGYTPLHVAAIHSHESVLSILVREYGANCNIRDNSGKKAYRYLRKELSAEVRELLGDPAASSRVTQRACSESQHFSDSSKNTFSKLFQSSVGHGRKSRLRSSFRSISGEQERLLVRPRTRVKCTSESSCT